MSVDISFLPADRDVVVVPIMQVPDLGYLSVDRRTGEVDTSVPQRSLHENDRQPLEAARRIKNDHEDVTIVAMAIDNEEAVGGLREALAWGADAAVLLAGPGVAAEPVARANLFAQAIGLMERVRLVVIGTETMEPDWSLVGGALSGILDWPLVPGARELHVQRDGLHGLAMLGASWAPFETSRPAVATVRPHTLKARWPTAWSLADAYDGDNVRAWTLSDLDTDGRLLSRLTSASETRNMRVVKAEKRENERFTDPPEISARTLGKRLARRGYLGGF